MILVLGEWEECVSESRSFRLHGLGNLVLNLARVFNQALCILDKGFGASSEERRPLGGVLGLDLMQHPPKSKATIYKYWISEGVSIRLAQLAYLFISIY